MKDAELYYTPPTDEIFNEVKNAAISIWSTMGEEPSYSQGKIGRIRDIGNIEDNLMYMVAMFDMSNQRRLSKIISEEARKAISDRIVDGGGDHLNPFNYD